MPGMHLHDLRHADATWAAVGGATLKDLMEHLGHASARAAIIYQHAAADRGRKIADALTDQARAARSESDGAREPQDLNTGGQRWRDRHDERTEWSTDEYRTTVVLPVHGRFLVRLPTETVLLADGATI